MVCVRGRGMVNARGNNCHKKIYDKLSKKACTWLLNLLGRSELKTSLGARAAEWGWSSNTLIENLDLIRCDEMITKTMKSKK